MQVTDSNISTVEFSKMKEELPEGGKLSVKTETDSNGKDCSEQTEGGSDGKPPTVGESGPPSEGNVATAAAAALASAAVKAKVLASLFIYFLPSSRPLLLALS